MGEEYLNKETSPFPTCQRTNDLTEQSQEDLGPLKLQLSERTGTMLGNVHDPLAPDS